MIRFSCVLKAKKHKRIKEIMDKDDRLEIIEARDYKVVKGNEIIQKARYEFFLLFNVVNVGWTPQNGGVLPECSLLGRNRAYRHRQSLLLVCQCP